MAPPTPGRPLSGSVEGPRSLTNPSLFSGIGNAYAEEILHRARMSPLLLTHKLDDALIDTLPGLRRAVAAHRQRKHGNELLCALSQLLKASWPRHIDDL